MVELFNKDSRPSISQTYPICDYLLQTLSECSRRNLSVKFDTAIFRKGFCQRESVQLHIGIAMSQTFQNGSNDVVRSDSMVEVNTDDIMTPLVSHVPLLALVLDLVTEVEYEFPVFTRQIFICCLVCDGDDEAERYEEVSTTH
jgi:hypothetical protein